MKKSVLFGSVSLLMIFLLSSSINFQYPKIKSKSFESGEKLRYRVTYGFMDAGETVLTVKESSKKGAGNRSLYHVVGEGRTLGGFNMFFKVEDTYESYIDKSGAFPWFFVRRVNEGGYVINQDYTFKQDKQLVNNGKSDFKVPLGIQDMLSSFYYARTLDFENMKSGDITEFSCFMDDEIYPLKIKFVGREEIKIRKGKFNCLKFVPVVQEGRYFENEEDVEFWVTDDANRIPVLVKAKIPVGTVKMHLVQWEGLIEELSAD